MTLRFSSFLDRTIVRRRMLVFLGLSELLAAPAIQAQPIKPEVLQVVSVDALMTMVGATKAENNGRLELEFSDIALRGPLEIKARSDMPGTVSMVIAVGAPNNWYGNGQAGSNPTRPAELPKSKPAPVVLKAWQVPPGAKPVLRATFPQLERRQAFTLLAFAQGRWSIAVREAKLACAPGDCATRSSAP